jgi:hypothetical protein
MGFTTYYPRAMLAMAAENIATLLGGTELSAIDSNVRTDLLTAIGTLPASLSTGEADAIVAKDQATALTASNVDIAAALQVQMDATFNALKTGNAPKEQFDLCGFIYPFAARTQYNIVPAPTDLSGIGTSNGVNRLKFVGNNPSGYVTYEMWRREGDEGAWGPIGITQKQAYIDTPVTPGQYYEYKVRAVGRRATSPFSGTVVIYGVL